MRKRSSYLGFCIALMAMSAAAQTTVTTTGGTANNIPKFSGTATVVKGDITDANGFVGIGTTGPLSPLSVSGQIVIGGPYTGDASLHILNIYGGNGRLFQEEPTGISLNALNLSASTDSGGNDQWWSWGVNANTWTINPGINFTSPAPFMITSTGTVVANGLVLNNIMPVDNDTTNAHNYKIATLPTSAVSTSDHLHLLVTANYGWGATGNAYIDAVFANRNGFTYQYTVRGSALSSNAKLTAYNNTNGSVDIYISFGASAYSVAGFTVLENEQETVYPTPADFGATPAGTLVFDSSSSVYPAATFADYQGNISVAGNLALKGAGTSITFADGTTQSTAWKGSLCGGDYAESVDVTGDRTKYEPGDVMVVDPDDSGRFVKSSEPYSTLVAGIYSTKPGLLGRRQKTDPKTSTTEVPMAMVGIVPTKVSAENGAIKRGDLLVTSSTLGYAMKGTDRSLLTGAVVGKALGPLDSGTGVIEVLVSLQ